MHQRGLTEAPPLGGLAESKAITSHHVAGVLVPVFAIRSESDLGIGDVRGVRDVIDWLSEMGMSFLQILISTRFWQKLTTSWLCLTKRS